MTVPGSCRGGRRRRRRGSWRAGRGGFACAGGRPAAAGRAAGGDRARLRGGARGRGELGARVPPHLAVAHRRAPVGEAGQRRDHRVGIARDELGAQQHRVDVFGRVVVRQDGRGQVAGGPRRAQVAGGGEDGVDGVVRVGVARVQRVDPVLDPGRGHELHPPDGAGGRHRQVVAVIGLDFVDRREDLPRHAVLRRGRLVDGQQEQGDAVVGKGLNRGRRAGQLGREDAGLCGHQLRREGHVGALGGGRARSGLLSGARGALGRRRRGRGVLLPAFHRHGRALRRGAGPPGGGRDHDGPPSCREATRSASALDRANGTRYDGRRPQQGLTFPLTLQVAADEVIE